MKTILLNRIQTPDGTILTSYHRHDFKSYQDKNGYEYVVDGGLSYLRRGSNAPSKELCDDYKFKYKELSVEDDGKFETRRSNLHWGINYTADKVRLPETKYVLIKDLATDHIFAILKNVKSIHPIYRDTFFKELVYREEGYAE